MDVMRDKSRNRCSPKGIFRYWRFCTNWQNSQLPRSWKPGTITPAMRSANVNRGLARRTAGDVCAAGRSLTVPRVLAFFSGARTPMGLRLLWWLALAFLPLNISWAQDGAEFSSQTKNQKVSSALPDSPTAKATAQEQRPPRIFWIIPTFTVTESKAPTKLTPRQKLEIVVKDIIDPYTIGFTAFTAGIAQANNEPSGYGQGASGYGKRFGASYTDQATAGFFGGFLFPSILHEDPRYYRLGSGPFTHRFAHSLVRPVVTYKDSDGRTFNWCGLLGSLVSSGISNAYYPEEDRGLGKTFSRFAMGIPFSVIDHLVDEFGPDLQHMIVPKKKSKQ